MLIDHVHYLSQFLWVVANAGTPIPTPSSPNHLTYPSLPFPPPPPSLPRPSAVWASGELFFTPDYDNALSMFLTSGDALKTSRWYSSWVVMLALVPIVLLYLVWIPATVLGLIEEEQEADSLLHRAMKGASIKFAPTMSPLVDDNEEDRRQQDEA